MWVSPAQAGDPWGELLSECDANGDGLIQPNEEPPQPGVDPYFNFSRIDTNGDGSIDADEYEESIFTVAYREGFEAGLVAYWANHSTRDVLVNRGYGPQKNMKEIMAQLAEPARDLKVPAPRGTSGIFVAVKTG